MDPDHVLWFGDVGCHRADAAGGKGASLGRMTAAGLPVPPGFVVAAAAFEESVHRHGLVEEVGAALARVAAGADTAEAAGELRGIVGQAHHGGKLAQAISDAYRSLGDDAPVAVRSSACAEDGELASYAGQQETYLNVIGAAAVLDKVTACWASFFGERALFYRRLKGSLDDLGMAVVVQRMVVPDRSGVMFTVDPVRRRRDQMVIEAVFGLGEAVVSGLVTPDNYVATRDGRVKKATVSRQDVEIVRDPAGGTVEVKLPEERATARVLTDRDVDALVAMAVRLEEVFGGPQDVEWAIEGDDLYLLQSRPVTA